MMLFAWPRLDALTYHDRSGPGASSDRLLTHATNTRAASFISARQLWQVELFHLLYSLRDSACPFTFGRLTVH